MLEFFSLSLSRPAKTLPSAGAGSTAPCRHPNPSHSAPNASIAVPLPSSTPSSTLASTLASTLLMLSVLFVAPAGAQEADEPWSNPSWLEPEAAPSPVDLPLPEGTVVFESDLPEFILIEGLYQDLLLSHSDGHGYWQSRALAPLGIEAGSAAEKVLDGILDQARRVRAETFRPEYDREQQRGRFLREQLAFRQQYMARMAVVHAELLALLESRPGGLEALEQFVEEKVRPSLLLLVPEDSAEARGQIEVFESFGPALDQARRGVAIRLPKYSDSLSGDSILVSSSMRFPDCGEGLVRVRGHHSVKIMSLDRGTRLEISGRIFQCRFGFDRPGDQCSSGVVPVAVNKTASCDTFNGDVYCKTMSEYRGWARGYLNRNGRVALSRTIPGWCVKEDRCEDDDWPSF